MSKSKKVVDGSKSGAVVPLEDCPHVSGCVGDTSSREIDGTQACKGCSSVEENWVCLVCFEINCSRFQEGHALEHFKQSKHSMALSLRDHSVWCYECEYYISNNALDRFSRIILKALELAKPREDAPSLESKEMDCTWQEMHGFKGSDKWAPPRFAAFCDEEARPGYMTSKAHEYLDTEETLLEKVKVLAQMIRQSTNMIAYTGAGISTGAGIGDYATKSSNSVVSTDQPRIGSPLDAEPTLAHRALTALYKAGHLKMWVQQNHDGLPQKAGMPQHAINEIHGAWFDPSNPVVPMSGKLRSDLFMNMVDWEESCDLCLAAGTSLSGMNADRCVSTIGKKALNGENGAIGAVIISVQRTRLDNSAALRIFAKIDEVMRILAGELEIAIPEQKLYEPSVPVDRMVEEDVFKVRFDANGLVAKSPDDETYLNLKVGSYVQLTGGRYIRDYGVVCGKSIQGHYQIRFIHDKKLPTLRLFGNWWIEAGVNGHGVVPGGLFPLVNVPEDQVPSDVKKLLAKG